MGEQRGHRAPFQIDWEIMLHCLKEKWPEDYFAQTSFGEAS